jgi:predicted nucleic-acid-binding Zn-ribbon protein
VIGEQEMRARLTPCPECRGERVLAEALNNIQLARPGTALPGITAPTSRLWAVVCINCGHATFYAKNPGAVLPTR